MSRAVIRSNRGEVSERFPEVGLTVRTGGNPYFEVAVATDPALFTDRSHRTPNNFYSTRGVGPLPAESGEAIYLLPSDVVRRFAGQDRLYYTIATFGDRSRAKADVSMLPAGAMPFVTISKSFTGRVLRQTVGSGGTRSATTGRYAPQNGPSLEWAGDAAQPGTQPVSSSSTSTSPASSASPTNGTAGNGAAAAPPTNGNGASKGTTSQASSLSYDDGYSDDLWQAEPTDVMRASAMGASSFDVGWADVYVVPQINNVTCWAASASMLIGWRDQISIDPSEIAKGAGPWAKYTEGLDLTDVQRFADAWELEAEPPQCYTVDGLKQLLESRGPLWVAAHVPGLHAIVVTGIYGDGTPDGTYIRINDPWGRASGSPGAPGTYNPTPGQGSQYVLTYTQFAQEYEAVAADQGADVQILHVRAQDMSGRSPMVTSQAFSIYQSVTQRRGGSPHATRRGTDRALAVPAAVIPIASAIVGAVMNRVVNNEGDIHWELDQLQGLKHPGNDAANQGTEPFQTVTTPVAGWPYVENLAGDRICADFEMVWQYNGHSLGNIQVSNTTTNDAIGWGLNIKETINDDANNYGGKAAVRVRFYYQFNRAIGSDVIAITDYTLFADGTFNRSSRWTQGGEAQALAAPISHAMGPEAAVVAKVGEMVISRLLQETDGDIHWTVEKAKGMKYVGNDPKNAGTQQPTWKTIAVKDWPYIENKLGDGIYAEFEIRYQYDGRSIGNITITNTKTNDAVGWGLDISVQIMDDDAAYQRDGGPSFAAMKVQFYWRFSRFVGSDSIAITDFTLYGDGTYNMASRWTQD